MRISDWSSDVCSSDLYGRHLLLGGVTVSGSLTERTDFDKVGDVRYVSSDYAGADIPAQSGIKSWNGVLTTNVALGEHTLTAIRSEERRVGQEWLSPCRSRWSRNHSQKQNITQYTT